MDRLSRWATGRNVVVLLAVFLLMNFVVIPTFYPKFATLDTLPTYTPEEAYRHLASYGEQGREQYLLAELTLDLLYPLTTALFFALLITYSFRRGFPEHPWTHWLSLIAVAEWAVDLLENASITTLLLRYPEQLPAVASIGNFFTVLKFALTPFELIFVIGLVAWLVRSLRQRSRALAASG